MVNSIQPGSSTPTSFEQGFSESKASSTNSSLNSTLMSTETPSFSRCLYDWTLGLFVRFFSWVFFCGCFYSSRLEKRVPGNQKMDARKRIWFNEGLRRFHEKSLKSDYKIFSQDNQPFELRKHKTPAYFSDLVRMEPQNSSSVGTFYDFEPFDEDKYYEAWVDFANKRLLGATLTHHNAQEEVLAAEFPELLMYGMKHLEPNTTHTSVQVRSGKKDGVQKGSPSPLLFEGLWHVQKVDVKATYGRKFGNNVTTENAKTFIKDVDSPQKVNILAMAAPKLKDGTCEEQSNQKTLEDLFNTFVAGFTLFKEQADRAEKKGLIHTGPIGAGIYKNDPSVVYALQRLAADYVGVDIRFHGYNESQNKKGCLFYYTILEYFIEDYLPEERTIQNLLKSTSETCKKHLLNL